MKKKREPVCSEKINWQFLLLLLFVYVRLFTRFYTYRANTQIYRMIMSQQSLQLMNKKK